MEPQTDDAWLAGWLDGIGPQSMSQRQVASIEKHGGLDVAKREATKRGIHLVELVDDHGVRLVAASKSPFRVIC